jgi:hypothetical protein
VSLTSTARELRMWGDSLQSIARDLENAIEQVGDELQGDEDGFVRHLSERITNIESLLQQVRLGLWQELTEAKLRKLK